MAATILREVYAYNPRLTREWPVASGTLEGTAVLSPAGNQPGVTITPRGDSTAVATLSGGYSITYPNGAVGQRSDSATVAVDGTWSGAVVGADNTTPKGTLVYIDSTGALTLTATSNTKFGVVDTYPGKGSASETAVKIGVFA